MTVSRSHLLPPPGTPSLTSSDIATDRDGTLSLKPSEHEPHDPIADEQAHALRQLETELGRLRQPGSDQPISKAEIAQTARQLLDCVMGSTLRVNASLGSTISRLSSQGWDALQLHAQATQKGGICEVALGEGVNLTPCSVMGLARLPQLRHLSFQPQPSHSEINLRRLNPTVDGLHVQLIGPIVSPLMLTLPEDSRAHAHADEASLAKAMVRHVDRQGQPVGEPRVLSGLMYFRRPVDFGPTTAAADFRTAQAQAIDLNLNCTVEFAPSRAKRPGLSTIACRHLGIQWLRDRAQFHQIKASQGALQTPFSYRAFKTAQALRRHVPATTQGDYERLMQQGTRSLLEPRNFGRALATEFAGMQPGQTRRFALTSNNHLMAVELRVKPVMQNGQQTGVRYVVNFYDPNPTATHKRLVVDSPEALHGLSLARWTGTDGLADYALGDPNAICALFRWDEGKDVAPAGAPPQDHLSASTRSDALYSDAIFRYGRHDLVREWIDSTLDSKAPYEEKVQRLAAHSPDLQQSGLWLAAGSGHQCMTETFSKAVLQERRITRHDRYMLLKGSDPATRRGSLPLPLWLTDCVAGRRAASLRYLHAIANSAPGDLNAHHRLELLRGGNSRPLLFHLAWSTSDRSEEGANPLHAHMAYQYLRTIATSGLPQADKQALAASPHSLGRDEAPVTAAQAALRGGSCQVAGAALCAVLDAGLGLQETRALLDALKVGPREVMKALSRAAPDAQPWGPRIMQALMRPEFRSLCPLGMALQYRGLAGKSQPVAGD